MSDMQTPWHRIMIKSKKKGEYIEFRERIEINSAKANNLKKRKKGKYEIL